MTEQELINNGFKKRAYGDSYWFELKIRNHLFLTNDTYGAKKKDEWHIGYQDTKQSEVFWFNRNLTNDTEFKMIFHLLTGIGFKLAHQRKLIK
jgi:hypothetical protein